MGRIVAIGKTESYKKILLERTDMENMGKNDES